MWRSCLSFALLSLRANAVAPHEKIFADNLAFEHLPPICDGHCFTLYQQRMPGWSDWSPNLVKAENVNNHGSSGPLSTWEGFKLGRLDILMPTNSCGGVRDQMSEFQVLTRLDRIRLHSPPPSINLPIRVGYRTPCKRAYALVGYNCNPMAAQSAPLTAAVVKRRIPRHLFQRRCRALP